MKKPAPTSVTFEMVRDAAFSLPNVEEGTAWGFPVLRTSGKMFLCFREDLDSLVVMTSVEQRDEMIETDPETYYTTDHHRNYPCVLARRAKLNLDILPDLLRMAWRSIPQKKARAKRGAAH